MPANVESMFSARGIVPWHNLGTVVEGVLTSAEAIRIAGLDWNVVKHPIFARIPAPGESSVAPAHGKFKRVDSLFATVRESDSKPLGVVGAQYVPVQNRDLFAVLDSLVEAGEMRYETAGSLDGGATVWMLGIAGDDMLIAGEPVRPYFLAKGSHDGTSAVRLRNVSTRVVCANTLASAMGEAVRGNVTVRHTSSADGKLREAARLMGLVTKTKAAFVATAEALLARTFTANEREKLALYLVPKPEIGEASRREMNGWETRFESLMKDAFGARDLSDIRHTAWGALNAVADYEQHLVRVKGSDLDKAQTLFKRATDGPLTAKAFEFLTATI